MPLLDVSIRDRVAELADDAPAYICGNEGYTVVFEFDEEWGDIEVKTMRVTWLDTFTGQQRHIDTEFAGQQLSLPVITDAYGNSVQSETVTIGFDIPEGYAGPTFTQQPSDSFVDVDGMLYVELTPTGDGIYAVGRIPDEEDDGEYEDTGDGNGSGDEEGYVEIGPG